MEEFRFVTKDDLLFFHQQEMEITRGVASVRDELELDACLESPKHTFDGKYLYNVFEMAAQYIISFCVRHPFTDGNKRISAVCSVVFLEANGNSFQELYEEELAGTILDHLNKKITDSELI